MRLEIRGEYPSNWKAISTEVKQRAGWRCIRCDHGNDSANGYALTVHHLNGDKSNCQWWNLLALCQRCHLVIQGRVIPERPWLFSHSPWFQIYAAGFYAWYHEQLEITREEAELNTSRYLAMGQPWLAEART